MVRQLREADGIAMLEDQNGKSLLNAFEDRDLPAHLRTRSLCMAQQRVLNWPTPQPRPTMLDLFDVPVIPGIATRTELVTADEEARLIRAIDGEALTPFRFQQWTGKRLTHSFGFNYDFQQNEVRRGEPIPDWLMPLRTRMAAFACLPVDELVQALLIRYDAGAGIGWHRDRPVYEHVLGISLGVPATMRFRRRDGERWHRASLPLEPRGAYHLYGEARREWEHSIAPMERPRHSITFRTMSEAGRRATARLD